MASGLLFPLHNRSNFAVMREACRHTRREYNKFVASVAEESDKMKAIQKEAVAKQVQLDEESLARLKEAEAKSKVGV